MLYFCIGNQCENVPANLTYVHIRMGLNLRYKAYSKPDLNRIYWFSQRQINISKLVCYTLYPRLYSTIYNDNVLSHILPNNTYVTKYTGKNLSLCSSTVSFISSATVKRTYSYGSACLGGGIARFLARVRAPPKKSCMYTVWLPSQQHICICNNLSLRER
jgi:hypothetical protein